MRVSETTTGNNLRRSFFNAQDPSSVRHCSASAQPSELGHFRDIGHTSLPVTVNNVEPGGEVAFIDLEFETGEHLGAPLGDLASTLNVINDLLRDLATIAADPSDVQFREIQVVAIDMRRPLTIRLSLRAISVEAVKAFQEICRDIIVRRRADITAAVTVVLQAHGPHHHLTGTETERLGEHIAALQNAEVPLRRVVVKTANVV